MEQMYQEKAGQHKKVKLSFLFFAYWKYLRLRAYWRGHIYYYLLLKGLATEGFLSTLLVMLAGVLAAQNLAIWKSWFKLYQNLSLLAGVIWCHSVLHKNIFLKCNTLDCYLFPNIEQNITKHYHLISVHGLELDWFIAVNVRLILVNLSLLLYDFGHITITDKSTLLILASSPLILQRQVLHSLEAKCLDEKKFLSCILKFSVAQYIFHETFKLYVMTFLWGMEKKARINSLCSYWKEVKCYQLESPSGAWESMSCHLNTSHVRPCLQIRKLKSWYFVESGRTRETY